MENVTILLTFKPFFSYSGGQLPSIPEQNLNHLVTISIASAVLYFEWL